MSSWAYLAGIIDGEGYIGPRYRTIEIVNKSSATLDFTEQCCRALGVTNSRYDSLVVPKIYIGQRSNLYSVAEQASPQSIKWNRLVSVLNSYVTHDKCLIERRLIKTEDEARYYMAAIVDGEGYISTLTSNRCVFIGNNDLNLLQVVGKVCRLLDITYTLCVSNKATKTKPTYYALIIRSRANLKRLLESIPLTIDYKIENLYSNCRLMRNTRRRETRCLV